MIGFIKHFESNKTMSIKISDNSLLKKCTTIWKKFRSLVGKKFNSEPVYGDNDKYIKTKVMIYGDKVNSNFQDEKVLKENASNKFTSIIILGFVAERK